MIGIIITQEIKTQNKLSNSVGSILTRGNYPHKWWGTKKVVGGYRSLTDLHAIDGWADVVEPAFDNTTQKLGNLFFDGNVFTYTVIDLTQQEIDDLSENGQENEAAIKSEQHIDKGQQLFNKCYRRIWRRKNKLTNQNNNKLTQSEARSLMNLLGPTYRWLLIGDFKSARDEINQTINNNQVELDATPGMINTAEKLKTDIVDYLTSIEYDL